MSRRYVYLFLLATAAYVLLTFSTPINKSSLDHYHVSLTALHLLYVTLIIPIILIWAAAIYGYAHLRHYVEQIKKDPDGQGLSYVATGLGILAIGLVVNSLVSSVISYFSATRLSLVPTEVIIDNYLSVILMFLCFWFLYRGSAVLTKLVPKKPELDRRRLFFFTYAVLGIVYANRSLHNPQKNIPATYTTHGLYYLPDVLILLTVLLPYLIAWLLGIMATIQLIYYRQHVKGVIYRDSLKLLAAGISVVIIASIGEQVLAFFDSQLQSSSLSVILVILYLLLIFIGVGFLMIARGAKRLRQLEGL